MKCKQFILLTPCCIIYVIAFAQPIIRSQKVFGGNAQDYLTYMDLTSDGGYVLGGHSNSDSSGQKSENRRGSYDYWILKLDSAGKIQWDKTLGGSRREYFSVIQQTSDDGYILGGTSYSNKSGEKSENLRGLYDYWVVKLDHAGRIQWDKTIGGNDGDWLASLQQTADGGYILAGYSYSNKSGEKSEDSRGLGDYWVVKLDSQGNIQWDKTIGGSDYEGVYSVQQTGEGGYILGGISYSNKSGEKSENSRGLFDYWVVKLDSKGKIQWDKTIGGSDWDGLNSLQQTSDGGYILGGLSQSNVSGEKIENSRGEFDYWVVKLNSSGKIQWDKTIGGSGGEGLISLQQTTEGGYILGGWSDSNKSGEKTENSRGFDDYWVVKVNSSGNIQWDKTVGGNRNDWASSIKEIDKDHYVVTGYSESGISGDKKRRSRGSYGYWLVDLDARGISNTTVASSNTQSLLRSNITNNKGFSIYPNPTKNILHIQTNSKATFSLTNQSGKILLTKTIEGNGVLNVAAIPAGLYYLKNNTTGAMQKIIVSK